MDYTKLRRKLVPDKDGEPFTNLRVATVNAVNSDGTVDLLMASGVIIPGVSRLANAYAPSGAVVQVISLRGSMLVIGATGSTEARGAIMKSGTTGNIGPGSGPTSFSSAVSFGMTFPAAPHVYINQSTAPGGSGQWTARAISITTTGFTLQAYGPTGSGWTSPFQWTAIYNP